MGRDPPPGSDPLPQRALGGRATARVIDEAGQVQAALAIADAQVPGDVAQDVDPAGLARHVRVHEVQRGMEAALAVGGDQLELTAGEAAADQRGEECFPRPLPFLADQAIVEEFPLPGGGDAVGDEDESAPHPIGGFDP